MTDESVSSGFIYLAVIMAGFAAFIPACVVLNAFAVYVLWGWFACPVFGVEQIGVAEAAGLVVLTGYLTHAHVAHLQPKEDARAWEAPTQMLLRPVIAVLVSWPITWFMP